MRLAMAAGPAVPGGSLSSWCVATAGRQGKHSCCWDSLNRKPGQQQQQPAGWMPPGTLPGIPGEPHTAPECVRIKPSLERNRSSAKLPPLYSILISSPLLAFHRICCFLRLFAFSVLNIQFAQVHTTLRHVCRHIINISSIIWNFK